MGNSAIFTCNRCKNEFEADDGGGFQFAMYRCVDCDLTMHVPLDKRSQKYICKRCKGEMRDDIGPMCPKCLSRDIKLKEITLYYD